MELGKRLKQLRKKLKLTQKDLAKKIKGEIDYTYIGKIERGNQNPSLKILKKISDTLNVELGFFFSNKPVELYLQDEDKNNKKREKILKLLCDLDEEELKFIFEIINFLKRYKNVQNNNYKPLKVAEKKDKYRADI